MSYAINETQLEHRPKIKMSQGQIDGIRKILGLPSWTRLPRCAAKSRSFVRKREAEGDFSHSDKKHICDKCRCQRTAGLGTRGDFYGLGPETGHYGCGWCYKHETGRRKRFAEQYAVEHMRLLQGVGMGDGTVQEYQLAVAEDARIATTRRELNDLITTVKDWMGKFQEMCLPEDKVQADAIAEQLKIFNDLIATNGCVEKDELKAILELTTMAIVMRSGLTEKGRAGPIAMSDDTRFENIRKFAETISKLKMNDFKVAEEGYVPIGEIQMRLPRMLSVAQRFIAKKDDWDKFIQEFRMIWANLKGERT